MAPPPDTKAGAKAGKADGDTTVEAKAQPGAIEDNTVVKTDAETGTGTDPDASPKTAPPADPDPEDIVIEGDDKPDASVQTIYASCSPSPQKPAQPSLPASQMGGVMRVMRSHVTFDGTGEAIVHFGQLPHEAVLMRDSVITVVGDCKGKFGIADPESRSLGEIGAGHTAAIGEIKGLDMIKPLRAMAGIDKQNRAPVQLVARVEASGPVTIMADLRYVLR